MVSSSDAIVGCFRGKINKNLSYQAAVIETKFTD